MGKNKNKNYVHSITKLHVPINVDNMDMIMTTRVPTVNIKEKLSEIKYGGRRKYIPFF